MPCSAKTAKLGEIEEIIDEGLQVACQGAQTFYNKTLMRSCQHMINEFSEEVGEELATRAQLPKLEAR